MAYYECPITGFWYKQNAEKRYHGFDSYALFVPHDPVARGNYVRLCYIELDKNGRTLHSYKGHILLTPPEDTELRPLPMEVLREAYNWTSSLTPYMDGYKAILAAALGQEG